MSKLKDILDRFKRDDLPTRVHGKTAEQWEKISMNAETTRIISETNMWTALEADREKNPAAYARRLGECSHRVQGDEPIHKQPWTRDWDTAKRRQER